MNINDEEFIEKGHIKDLNNNEQAADSFRSDENNNDKDVPVYEIINPMDVENFPIIKFNLNLKSPKYIINKKNEKKRMINIKQFVC